MKKIFFLIIVIGMTIMFSCSCTKPKVDDPTPPPSPPKPEFTSLKADTAWYNESDTITYQTKYSTSSIRPDGSTGGSSDTWTTPHLISPTTFVFTAIGPGGTTKDSIISNVWSQKMTLMCHYGDMQLFEDISFYVTDSLNPSTWSYFPLDYQKKRYLPNNRIENYSSTGTYLSFSTWYWLSGETQIRYGGPGSTEIWNVGYIDTTGFMIWRDTPDVGTPTFHRYIRKYKHV